MGDFGREFRRQQTACRFPRREGHALFDRCYQSYDLGQNPNGSRFLLLLYGVAAWLPLSAPVSRVLVLCVSVCLRPIFYVE